MRTIDSGTEDSKQDERKAGLRWAGGGGGGAKRRH